MGGEFVRNLMKIFLRERERERERERGGGQTIFEDEKNKNSSKLINKRTPFIIIKFQFVGGR